jgi:hypothetical protein
MKSFVTREPDTDFSAIAEEAINPKPRKTLGKEF